jgi:hypothetical protein
MERRGIEPLTSWLQTKLWGCALRLAGGRIVAARRP